MSVINKITLLLGIIEKITEQIEDQLPVIDQACGNQNILLGPGGSIINEFLH